MIEQAMIFALGFLVSGLLALLFLPAFWRRAMRLSARRLEMLMPLSMDEIVAERDQLRAEAAADRRRVEQKVEALVESRARDMAEIGRRAAMIADLDTSLDKERREVADLTAKLATRDAELQSALSEVGALHQEAFDLASRLDQRSGELAAARASIAALEERTDDQRTEIAALSTRIAGLEFQQEDLRKSLKTTQLELADKIALVQKLSDERDFLRNETHGAVSRRDQLLTSIDTHQARIGELETAHRAERRQRVRLEKDLAAANQALTDAEKREQEVRETHERHIEFLRGSERELAQRIEVLKAQNAGLQGALEAARKDHARKPEAGQPAVAPEDAALLREAISDIGAQVSRLVGALEAEGEDARLPKAIGERVRALQSQAERKVAAG